MNEKRAPRGFVDVVSRAHDATVVIGICTITRQGDQTTYGNLVSLGSGFFINGDGLLLTAKHVVSIQLAADQVYFALHKTTATQFWLSTSQNIVHDFPDIDVCAIKFDRKVSYLPLSQYRPKQGSDIGIYGYPASQIQIQNNQLVGGLVKPRSSRTTISNIEVGSMNFGTIKLVDKVIIESQFIFVKGNSGGPVFDAKNGKVVGIVTGVRHIPQDAQTLTVTINGQNQSVIAVPYASYAYAVSISEVLPRLSPSDFTRWWK